MTRLYSLLYVVIALLFNACTEQQEVIEHIGDPESILHSSVSDAAPATAEDSCSNILQGTPMSLRLFEETLLLWEETFSALHDSPQIDSCYISASSLSTWLQESELICGDDCYKGFKAYLALPEPATTKKEAAENLCLILVPYTFVNGNMTDTLFPSPPSASNHHCILITPTDSTPSITHVDQGTAQSMIATWSTHYSTVADSLMVPVTSFVIPKETLSNEIEHAISSGYDGNVYFTFGYHTVPQANTEYCIQNAKAYSHNPDVYGYFALNLMLSTKTPSGPYEHSEDFLRPCPRYCGNAMFSATY